MAADYFNLVAWEKTAEFCGKYLAKGSKVLASGRLKNNSYKDNKDLMHYNVDVIVTSVEFMNHSPDDDDMTF